MSINPKGKAIHLARLTVRSDGVDGKAIPEDEMQCDFIISNNEVDGHGSIMTESTLRNYAADAAAGVPFLLNHSNDLQMQIGQTIGASYDEADKRTIATVRILRDTESTPDNMKVNEYIRRIERNMYNSVSVGFKDAKETCNMRGCGKEIFNWTLPDPCPHIPKRSYGGEVCTYNVDDGHLREVSLTATPSNANTKLLDTREWNEDLAKIKTEGELSDTLSDPKTLLERDGLKYRNLIIDEAIKSGIRAKDGFDEAAWKHRFNTMEAAHIQAQKEDWDEIGDARWGKGGRTTEAIGGDTTREENSVALPAWLFS